MESGGHYSDMKGGRIQDCVIRRLAYQTQRAIPYGPNTNPLDLVLLLYRWLGQWTDMSGVLDPFRFMLIAVAGWMNQGLLAVIAYLREENRVLREQLGGRRLPLNDGQRRRLAAKLSPVPDW